MKKKTYLRWLQFLGDSVNAVGREIFKLQEGDNW